MAMLISVAACLPDLGTLQISHNKLIKADDIRHLTLCSKISVLDISHNKLDDPDIVEVFSNMESLVSMSIITEKLKRLF